MNSFEVTEKTDKRTIVQISSVPKTKTRSHRPQRKKAQRFVCKSLCTRTEIGQRLGHRY